MAARLPADLLARLRAALSPDDALIEAADPGMLAHLLRTQPIDLVVLDPLTMGVDRGTHDDEEPSLLLTILAEFRSVPTILYSSYTRDALRALLPLARYGAHHVVFRGFDDTPERLTALVDQVAASVLGERLLAVVLPRLATSGAPQQVSDAMTRLFHAPQAFRTVHQLAAVAGRQRGMLDRWMHRSGLAPSKVMILAARVAWAHHYARAPGNRLKTLAARLGYTDVVRFGRHIKWMTGVTASKLRHDVSADDLLRILTERVTRHD